MMRVEIYEKAGRIRLERQFEIGKDRWQPITRLVYSSITEAVSRFPVLWKQGRTITEVGVLTAWDLLSDDLMCEL